MKVIQTARTQGRAATTEPNTNTWLRSMPRDKQQQLTIELTLHRTEIASLSAIMLHQQSTVEAVIAHLVRAHVKQYIDAPALSGVYGSALAPQAGGTR